MPIPNIRSTKFYLSITIIVEETLPQNVSNSAKRCTAARIKKETKSLMTTATMISLESIRKNVKNVPRRKRNWIKRRKKRKSTNEVKKNTSISRLNHNFRLRMLLRLQRMLRRVSDSVLLILNIVPSDHDFSQCVSINWGPWNLCL